MLACDGARHYPINGGSAQRYDDLACIAHGPGERLVVSIFRGQPRAFPLRIAMMERHRLGSQAFMPLQGRRYLVVVAEPGTPASAPGRLHAFLARGDQGVNYAPGVWHHPLITLDEVSDFLVIDSRGNEQDCDESELAQAVLLEHPGRA